VGVTLGQDSVSDPGARQPIRPPRAAQASRRIDIGDVNVRGQFLRRPMHAPRPKRDLDVVLCSPLPPLPDESRERLE
jgi:hypothetical protein